MGSGNGSGRSGRSRGDDPVVDRRNGVREERGRKIHD